MIILKFFTKQLAEKDRLSFYGNYHLVHCEQFDHDFEDDQ
jgi:hypothetical protein